MRSTVHGLALDDELAYVTGRFRKVTKQRLNDLINI